MSVSAIFLQARPFSIPQTRTHGKHRFFETCRRLSAKQFSCLDIILEPKTGDVDIQRVAKISHPSSSLPRSEPNNCAVEKMTCRFSTKKFLENKMPEFFAEFLGRLFASYVCLPFATCHESHLAVETAAISARRWNFSPEAMTPERSPESAETSDFSVRMARLNYKLLTF